MIMSEGKNTEIATVKSGYMALANNSFLEEAMAGECAGLEFTIDRVKLPAGGGTAFEIPSEEGEETEMVKDITGVILYNHPAFAYYAAAFAGGHAAPDCSSMDGVTGVGLPGGSCRDCPYNKFGSGDGQSKLCKNKRMLYILREGELFPVALSLPTGSLRTFTNYVKRQLTKGRKLSQIVTKVSLKKATSAAGIAYSQAVFTFDRALTAEEIKALSGAVESCKTYAANSFTDMIAEDDLPFLDGENSDFPDAMN